jgi:sigma-B regulation protein RsbU (phosphoserine phosphatase)
VPISLPRDVVTADSDTDPVRVLLVEDNPGDARLLEEIVADAGGGDITIRHVPALGEALTLLDLELFDVALLDLSLPDAHGLEVLAQVHGRAPALPIVVLSGLEDEELAVSAVHEGAQDYLVKRHLQGELLVRSLRYAIERAHVLARLEQAKAEQLRIKDELLSLVSHELRTPLAASYQFVTILLDGLAGPLAEQQRHYLEITLRNLLDLRAMVDDLLESNRGQAGIEVRPHPASVSELVDDAITTFSAAVDDKQLELRGAVEPGLPMVLADPGRVGQILGNLIGNAVKHTPAGARSRSGPGRWPASWSPSRSPTPARASRPPTWTGSSTASTRCPAATPAAAGSASACTSAASWSSPTAARSGPRAPSAGAARSPSPSPRWRPRLVT